MRLADRRPGLHRWVVHGDDHVVVGQGAGRERGVLASQMPVPAVGDGDNCRRRRHAILLRRGDEKDARYSAEPVRRTPVAPAAPGLPVEGSHRGQTCAPAGGREAVLHAARPRSRGQGPTRGRLLVERTRGRDDDGGASPRGNVGHRALTGLDDDDRGRIDGSGRVVAPLPRAAQHRPGPVGCVGRGRSHLGLGGVAAAAAGQDEDPATNRGLAGPDLPSPASRGLRRGAGDRRLPGRDRAPSRRRYAATPRQGRC